MQKICIDKIARREEAISKHINVVRHYDDDTLLDKSGKLIKIFKLSGLDSIAKDESALNGFKERRNNLFKNLSSDFAVYFWHVRRKTSDYPSGQFESGFAKEVNAAYQEQLKQSEMYYNQLYLALMTKQPEGLLNKAFSVFNFINHSADKNAKRIYLIKRHKDLCDAAKKIKNALSDYQCEQLGVYEKKGIEFSASLEFLSILINFNSFRAPLEMADASKVLPRKRLFFNNRAGAIEIRAADDSKKFAAMLSIKAYSPFTYQGILDQLSILKCEYTITQSFRFYDRHVAKNRMRDQQKEMLQSKEESISQTDQIDDVFDETASGEVGYGIHHFTLACYADNLDALNKNIALICSSFTDLDISCVREDVACECAFWAQLPGNFGYVCRPADISTKNMAGLVSLHNDAIGKISDNHWGDAVCVLETPSGSPYYFNFHYKDVGNFLVFGAMGSGKTVLVGFLILQSMKFGGKRIIFDKDRGLEILVRAMGGIYEIIKPGIATGFNPCQLEDKPENRKFLSVLFAKMLTVNDELLTEEHHSVIERAINGMYQLDKNTRQLRHIASFFGTKKKGSLRNRFDQWHSDGTHAWLFDNAIDRLNLHADILGFDLSHILNDKACKTPALMYLTYCIEKEIEGHRAILFCDEGWNVLNDPYFRSLIDNWSRTPRKKNNIFGLATQVVNDTANSSISRSLNESSFCKIFFPNPSADKNIYIENFGLTEHEYHLVKTLPDDQHFFLLKHGRSTNQQSVVVRPNLSGLEDAIAVISAREETLLLLDQVRAEVGDDPSVWLPIFHERRKQVKV